MSKFLFLVVLFLMPVFAVSEATKTGTAPETSFIGKFHHGPKNEPRITTHSKQGFPLEINLKVSKDLELRTISLLNKVVRVEVKNFKSTSDTTATAALVDIELSDNLVY